MRLPDNSVQAVLDRYVEDLSPAHPREEVAAMAAAVFAQRLGWDRTELLVRRHDRLSESELLLVYKPLKRLRAGEPLQYILGQVRFLGLEIGVGPGVLIPRPETEELVDLAMAGLSGPPQRVLDVGTGSGAIALALKHRFPGAWVMGLDVSEAALERARANAARTGLEVEWILCDVLDPAAMLPPADLLISNPPYVLRTEAEGLASHVKDHEPALALFVDDADPGLFHRTIARKALTSLPPGGQLWMEGHRDHIAAMVPELQTMGYASVRVVKDLSGADRSIHAVR